MVAAQKRKGERRWLRLRTLFVLLIMYPWLNDGIDLVRGEWEEYELKREWPEFAEEYLQGRELLREDAPGKALPFLERAVALGEERADFRKALLARTYAVKAEAHLQLWQNIDAEAALQKAMAGATPEQQKGFRRRLSQVQKVIEQNEKERTDRTEYVASPGLGPSGRLRGRVVTAYVFIDDGKESRWSQRTRQAALRGMDRVEDWYGQWAQQYGGEGLQFVRRVFVYDRDPLLRNAFEELINRDVQTGYDLAERMAELEGAETVNGFLERLRVEERADQVLLLLHVNKQSRSYAMRCSYGCWAEAEYAFLFQTNSNNDWDALLYAQAHEGLHLFGADDLYNIDKARDYAVRDIMNHLPRYLFEARIDSITAYAIGWLGDRPEAPFPIEDAGGTP